MMNTKYDNRRELERFTLEVSTKIEVLAKNTEGKVIELPTRNICSGGAYFSTPRPLPEGTEVKLDIILPLEKLKALKDCKEAYIKVTGKVLRTDMAGMSVRFNPDYQISPWKVENATTG
jgi:hypothetical protein